LEAWVRNDFSRGMTVYEDGFICRIYIKFCKEGF
jgi:hypothetical protein